MKLSRILAGATVIRQDAEPSMEVDGITADSRAAGPGCMFIAVPGFKVDGHDFVADAAGAGASVAVTERWLDGTGIPQVQVPLARQAMARVAANFHGRPSEKLTVIGITGTNGKTTTSYLVDAILRADGRKTGLIGGIEYQLGSHTKKAVRTTPEPLELQEMLSEIAGSGADAATLEVSSHGISLYRVACTNFDVAVFTNLTPDHLDLHHDMESYFRTKKRLFSGELDGPGEVSGYALPKAAVNIDDAYGKRLAAVIAPERLVTFGRSSSAVVYAIKTMKNGWQSAFELVTPQGTAAISFNLPGDHNIANALAAAACGHALGIDTDVIAAGLGNLKSVPGRFEPVEIDAPFSVVVDYAHNVDGLRKALKAAAGLTDGKLILVFGCPGERDRDKRPQMGLIAGKNTDFSVLTTDDCYNEAPEQILDEVEPGLVESGGRYLRIGDRRQAIEAALDEAGPGDLVLIAGKGHETDQLMASGPVPFSDSETVRELLGVS